MTKPADDDPDMFVAGESICIALTSFFAGDPAGAERELLKLKAEHPVTAVDVLFGMVSQMILDAANEMGVLPGKLVRNMALSFAKMAAGLEDIPGA